MGYDEIRAGAMLPILYIEEEEEDRSSAEKTLS